ncbi:MAG: hypothetical protein JWL74_217 [Alphaproteobacteria bacterium]|jgi:hypothetical protein|nr:hypothetical protein [Alphaproteobacteria bacterium]
MATDTIDLSPYDRRSPENVRRRLERMEHLLERAVPIPGTSKRLGLDVMLDMVPVGGSVVAAAMGSWLAWEARNLGVSKWTLARMAGNIGFDMLLGTVPVVGWVADYFFRSNTRNLRLLKRHLDKHQPLGAALDPSGTRRR